MRCQRQIKKTTIATEKSKKRYFERIEYKKGYVVLLTNWISKLVLRNHTSKKRSLRKQISKKKPKRHDIKEVVTKVKHQVCYVRIAEMFKTRNDIKIK